MTNPPDSTQIQELTARATEAAAHAYAPYSSFRVGAALLLDSGKIVSGCNVENASYRLTCCAEQTAIVSAVARFGPRIRIRAIAVTNLNRAASQPCGACRQTIAEFATPDTWITYAGEREQAVSCLFSALLPDAFIVPRP